MRNKFEKGFITGLFEEIEYLQEAEKLLEDLFYLDRYALMYFIDEHDKYKMHPRLMYELDRHFNFDDSE
jgi:hypothetical protein